MTTLEGKAPPVANGVETSTGKKKMSTKQLGNAPRQRPLSGRPPHMVGAEQAAWLINNFYTAIYGPCIQIESPRTMRVRIVDLTISLRQLERGSFAYQQLARQIAQFERIGQLLEMMPTF